MGEGDLPDDVFAAATENGPVSDVDIELIEEDWHDYRDHHGHGIHEYHLDEQRDAFLEQVRSFLDDNEVYSIDIQTPTDDEGLTRYEAWVVYGDTDG